MAEWKTCAQEDFDIDPDAYARQVAENARRTQERRQKQKEWHGTRSAKHMVSQTRAEFAVVKERERQLEEEWKKHQEEAGPQQRVERVKALNFAPRMKHVRVPVHSAQVSSHAALRQKQAAKKRAEEAKARAKVVDRAEEWERAVATVCLAPDEGGAALTFEEKKEEFARHANAPQKMKKMTLEDQKTVKKEDDLIKGTVKATGHTPGYSGFIPREDRFGAQQQSGSSSRFGSKTSVMLTSHRFPPGYSGFRPKHAKNTYSGVRFGTAAAEDYVQPPGWAYERQRAELSFNPYFGHHKTQL